MGVIHLKKDGKIYEVDDSMTVEELKALLKLPPRDILINSRGRRIRGVLRGKVKDGESIRNLPGYGAW